LPQKSCPSIHGCLMLWVLVYPQRYHYSPYHLWSRHSLLCMRL
jgi:hypothetical protein